MIVRGRLERLALCLRSNGVLPDRRESQKTEQQRAGNEAVW